MVPSMRVIGFAGLVAAGYWFAGPLRASQPAQSAQVLKSRGVIVSVQATVSDGQRLVTGLSADDFTILDNDRPQPLTVFTREVLPISVVMLFDTSMSMENSIGLLREGARQFVNRLFADGSSRASDLQFANLVGQAIHEQS